MTLKFAIDSNPEANQALHKSFFDSGLARIRAAPTETVGAGPRFPWPQPPIATQDTREWWRVFSHAARVIRLYTERARPANG